MKRSRITAAALFVVVTALFAPTASAAAKNETTAPSPSNTTVPTPAPTTPIPTKKPTPPPTKKYVPPPTPEPTASPTYDQAKHPTSIGRMIARTIGWLILLALSVLCFGAVMSNRYRIYYALRGLWYTFIRLDCTRWIIRKVRRQGPSSNASLNEIIFDQNDLHEGLLLNSNQ